MKKLVNGELQDMTSEEIQEFQKRAAKAKAKALHRPLTHNEIFSIITKAQVNTLEIEDQTSLKMKQYYPAFTELIGQAVKQGFKFTYQDKLYKTLQPDGFVIQEQYPPSINTASLYTEIVENHLGNEFDPIPYNTNMILEKDKYYVQYDIVYLCIEDSMIPVYADLKNLPRYVQEYGGYEPLF